MSEKKLNNTSPPLPWKTRITLSVISSFTDALCRSDGTVNRRFHFLDFKSSPNPNPVNGVKSFDVTVDSTRNLWFRLFVPTSVESNVTLPVIVFFHGGGFAFLSAASTGYDVVCRRFSRRVPAIVVSVDYRLSPEHKFPSQYEDGFDVLHHLDKNFSELLPKNADLSRCFLAGDSAGGNIAHHVALRAASVGDSTFEKVRIVGLIAIQPFFGGEERTESEIQLEGAPLVSVSRTDWLWKVYLPEGMNRDHEVVNVSGPNAIDISAIEKFPRTMVVIGGYDPLQDWQRRYYDWLVKSGKTVCLEDYPNSIHAFYVFPELAESTKLIEQVRDFINNNK